MLRAADRAARLLCANPGRGSYPLAARAEEAVYDARRRAADFFGAPSPENVIFTPGCTAAINYVLKGCLRPGDHVIISELEHNAVVRPLETLGQQGVRVSRARVLGKSPGEIVRAFERLIEPDTRMIFCTHASNVLGVTLPVEQIGRLCGRYGLLFGIDAAQSAGVLPVTLAAAQADFICVPAHKGLYGLMGLGLLITGRDDLPRSLLEGGTGSMSAQRRQPEELPDRLECGTLNLPGICALAEGIKAVQRTGTDKIYRHELSLMQQLYDGLCAIGGITLYAARPEWGSHVPLVSFNIQGMTADEAGEYLARQGIAVRTGYHCAYDAHLAAGSALHGTVRVCPSMYTTAQEIDCLLRQVGRAL